MNAVRLACSLADISALTAAFSSSAYVKVEDSVRKNTTFLIVPLKLAS